ncbi:MULTISPECIES: flagellar basal body rod protein FlgB [unclassified Janthinobacterium]|jgi:flagellar basal-body rod protein FlgB|uniref:flagellar basal body rod protein FlgB n=1 Tax=unclassified Janthinobacterium TaxID=2610881 RepID=UPI001613EF94|nr:MULTISPECIES: flagellar basal body rod protein FlgB [unclassified Janthinobacterium]MBB5608723.1 flagellar basal-body rod protein FlgB [Janthinobacterium sp. S3T4]MBB5613874.1 flagellar basal-body rod protein FlgB [Janthinobacterium sp. S3M3]
MIGKLDDYMRFNETALSLRSTRQEVLASNIANADTPNYKARDVDFASALKGALAKAGGAAPALKGTSPQHMAGKGVAGAAGSKAAGSLADGTPLLYRAPAQGAVDGNTVDMDLERNAFADNAIRYETAITLLNGQIKGMLTAIQGGQ